MNADQIRAEQIKSLELNRKGRTYREIAAALNLSVQQVQRRISGAKKAERLDPALAEVLAKKGVVDLAGLHSGWLLEKDDQGSGSSLYFYLGADEEKINFADAMRDVLADIPRLPPLSEIIVEDEAKDNANWIMLADLHLGGDYGDPQLEHDFNHAIDDLVRRMPKAEKAVLIELGDLFDANDHKGVTPRSGNPCDVKREDVLKNALTAVRLLRRAIYRLAETHPEVEVHFIKGNHDPDAYIAAMIGVSAHFEDVPNVNIVVTDDEYRVIQWGKSACFPHHGDTLKWEQLKDVFADQYPDEWAQAKAFRLLATAHFHHDRRKDLVGAVGRQFRTLHRPNGWAKGRGLFNHGTLTAITVHKERGAENETLSNIKPMLRGK